MKEIKVEFKTLTPLWTGDAWRECKEIKPSSIIGSLRFWFEVICYFSGICSNDDFNKESGRFEKEVDKEKLKKCLLEKGNSFEAKIECLTEQGIPLPSIIFGTTNWKSLIEIKEIKNEKEFKNYQFPIGSIDFPELEHNNKVPTWYFKKGFYGEFRVIFKVEEKILESIFYPLLNFIDKYGFWGGKWNIGYGRLKVLEVKMDNEVINDWKKEIFRFSSLNNQKYKDKDFNTFLKNKISDFESLTKKENTIQIFEIASPKNPFAAMIKDLIKTKAQKRAKFITNTEERHKIFGTTKPPPNDKNLLPQGSKILPYIYKENKQVKGGFLSIAGLLNLKGENNGQI